MNRILLLLVALAFSACQKAPEPASENAAPEEAVVAEAVVDPLDAALDAQSDDIKARYEYRHPKETLQFFGIEPGMTVLEGLPGRGWYTQVLLAYLGSDGYLIGANYSLEMYPLFSFAT